MSFRFGGKIVTDGLVLYLDAANSISYPGSGTSWYDLSNNKMVGALTNGPTFDSANGGSIVFDGTDDYGIVTQTLGQFSNSKMSIEMWIYPTSISSTGHVLLMDKSIYTDNYGMQIYIVNDSGNKIAVRGSSTNLALSDICLTVNQWQCINVSYDNTTCYIYVNSQSINGTNLTNIGSIQPSSYSVNIGKYGSLNDYYFTGKISNIKIYNKTLTATEVAQNYNAIKGRFGL